MRKVEDGYMKEIYTRGEYTLTTDTKASQEVVCKEIRQSKRAGERLWKLGTTTPETKVTVEVKRRVASSRTTGPSR